MKSRTHRHFVHPTLTRWVAGVALMALAASGCVIRNESAERFPRTDWARESESEPLPGAARVVDPITEGTPELSTSTTTATTTDDPATAPTTLVPTTTTTTAAPVTTPTTLAPTTTTTTVAPPATTTAAPVTTTTTVAPTTTTTAPVIISVPGVPAAGSVGHLGSEASLLVIDSEATAPAGTQWNSQYNYLDVRINDLTLDGVYIKGGIDFYGAGTLTIRNSIVEGGYGSWMIIMLRDGGGRLDLSDSTLRWRSGSTPSAGSGSGAIQITGNHDDSRIVRNDISGNPDGIQVAGNRWTIEQNWIHGLAMVGTYPNNTHNDGIQVYNGSGHRIVSNRFQIGAVSPYSNSPIFLQGSSIGAVLIQGNYLDGGGYSLYPQNGQISIIDNVFGPNHLWGEVLVENGASVVAWSNNTDSSGSVIGQP